jgi:hypothetical protein
MNSPDDPRFGSPQWIAPVTDLDKFRKAKKAAEAAKKAAAEGPDAEIIPLPGSGWENMPDATPITDDPMPDAPKYTVDPTTGKPLTESRGAEHKEWVDRQIAKGPREVTRKPPSKDPEPSSPDRSGPRHPYYPRTPYTPPDGPMRGFPPSSPPPSSPPLPGPPPQKKLPKKGPKTPKPPGAK